MAKINLPKKSTFIDMTAMVDMAFLLVTFFMLVGKFKPDEPVTVVTPKSTSDFAIPETNVLQIVIDSSGRVFFGVDNPNDREETLAKIEERYKIKFTDEEKATFKLEPLVGVPVNELKPWLAAEAAGEKYPQPGIPCDSSKNELKDWVLFARQSNLKLDVFVKGDSDSKYPVLEEIMNSLKLQKVHRYKFITELEA